MVRLHWHNVVVFILADTETETDENGLLELCERVHTAQEHRQVEISIGLSTHFISVCIGLGARQCE